MFVISKLAKLFLGSRRCRTISRLAKLAVEILEDRLSPATVYSWIGGGVTANTGSFDFAHSATWGGKGFVIDQNNQLNPNFTLTSQSGFNYSEAVVPEPAAAW